MVLTAVTEVDTEAWRLELAATEVCWARMVCGLGAGVAVSAMYVLSNIYVIVPLRPRKQGEDPPLPPAP